MIEGPIQTNNNGLVFYFDAKEPKSYVGKPTTNLLSYTDFTNIWYAYCGNGDGVVRNTTDVLAPDGTFTATKIIRGTSSTCSGAFYGWGLLHYNGSNLFTAGQTYTASVWARCESGTMQFILGLNDSHSAGTTINTTWQRITFTATASGLDRGLQFLTYDTSGRVYYVWQPQTELGSYASQFVASGATPGTRSNTQGLLDLTGNSTLNLSTMTTYTNTSGLNWSGNNYITTANNCNLTSDQTLTAWIKPTKSGANTGPHNTVICTDASYQYGIKLMNYKNYNRYGLWLGFGSSNYEALYAGNINDGVDKMFTGTWTQSTGVVKIYINAQLVSTINTGVTSPISLNTGRIYVGTGYELDWGNGNMFEGDIYAAAIYNRALSASEVLKNFNSQRSRYSV